MTEIIDVDGLKRHYQTGKVITKALNGVSFTVEKGEFLGIMGPSGSGKSTLLHQIGLLDHPTAGKVTIEDTDISTLTSSQRTQFRLSKLGFVFQQYRNLPELEAVENVALPARNMGRSWQEAFEKARELLEDVGLGDRMDHLPFELSGGEQQRVSIARALVNEPSILLADEATAQLDTESSENIMELFQKFNMETNQTIVSVSHEPEQEKYFDRIIRLRDGKIERIEE